MNPGSVNMRSHHSLKNSIIMDNSSTTHLNPVSARLGLTKKSSLNFRDDSSAKIKQQINLSHHYRTDSYPQPRISLNNSNQNEAYIVLGNKNKQYSHQSIQIDRRFNEIFTKIDSINNSIEKHQSRILILEGSKNYSHSHDATLSKIEVSAIVRQQLEKKGQRQSQNLQKIHSQINSLQFEVKNICVRPEFQKKVQNCVLSVKNNWISSSKDLEMKINQRYESLAEKLRKDYHEILDKIQQKWEGVNKNWQKMAEDFILLKNANANARKESKQNHKEVRGIGRKFVPLFQKPNFRLKFLGIVTMMGLHDDNPEEEVEVESQLLIYKVDEEGFVLDEQNRYIVNQDGNVIQLSKEQIRTLAEHKMFK